MKFSFSREWCAEKVLAEAEADPEVGAGLLLIVPKSAKKQDENNDVLGASRVALGRFIQLNRRKRKLSHSALSEKADIDVLEIISMENVIGYEPEPRTIYQLAAFFKVDQKNLMELSGLRKPKNPSYIIETVRHAARSESLEELTDQELASLEAMVSVLSEKHK